MTDWRDLTLESMPVWPLRYQLVACLVLLVMLNLVVWQGSITGVIRQYHGLQAQARTLQTQYDQQRSQADLLPDWSERAAKMQAGYRLQLARLPAQSDWPQVLADIETLSVETGVVLHALRWGNSENHDWYSVQPLHFEWQGSYASSGALLARLASMHWLLVVNELTMEPLERRSDVLQITGSARLYQISQALVGAVPTDDKKQEKR
ncbi:type 4a pilus biogenesis protein PilO [Photobacterium halotolerans]|uniref:Pilus assembly protein PilO n=1 Tax=Photobacterium halotolerans TaxID=265726 RepID=A0A0F5VE33_9GAMM|nr:type 4a pilus biogenesis protein PilO [Photobacterium halotolerans]KKD00037.1 hypothetical protein KY46_09060 [Photobacterium halotolerans]